MISAVFVPLFIHSFVRSFKAPRVRGFFFLGGVWFQGTLLKSGMTENVSKWLQCQRLRLKLINLKVKLKVK